MGTGGLFGQGSLTAAEGSVRVTRGKKGERDPSLKVDWCGQGEGRTGRQRPDGG